VTIIIMSKKEKKQKKQKNKEEQDELPKDDDSVPEVDDDKKEEEATAAASEEKVDDDEKKEEEDATAAAGGTKRKRKRKRKKADKAPEEKETDEQQHEEQQQQHTDSVERTVFVEGIPFDSTPDQVKEFFESHDISDVVELRLPTWQDSGRLRGYGHVLFGSQDSYDKALPLSGKYLQKRYLTIQPANAPKNGSSDALATQTNPDDPPPNDCRTLFVHNLPYGATEEEILKVFEKYGDIENDGVRIARNSVTRQSKGFAYVDFVSPKDAQKVFKAACDKNLTVGGRVVRLDFDTGKIKGSFRSASGLLLTKERDDKKKRQRFN
jgi:nucleolin